MHRYRLALRDIWNTCFWADEKLRHNGAMESWRRLKGPLFRSIVADTIGAPAGDKPFGHGFLAVPALPHGFHQLLVNTRPPHDHEAGVFEQVKGPFTAENIGIMPVDFFDWSPMEYRDLHYAEVLITKCDAHPEITGRHALADAFLLKYLYVNPAGTQPSGPTDSATS